MCRVTLQPHDPSEVFPSSDLVLKCRHYLQIHVIKEEFKSAFLNMAESIPEGCIASEPQQGD